MKIISWNINGIKSLIKGNHFNEIFENENPDILCFQEVKSDSIPDVENYNKYLFPSQKKGSGVAVYFKDEPINIKKGIGNKKFDEEGRVIRLEFKDFILMNAYFPSGSNPLRLEHKFDFYDEITEILNSSKKPIILCGDFNRISKEIDAKNIKNIKGKPGFLKEEKEWFENILKDNYFDGFRAFHKEGDKFTWWSYGRNARELNNGYRLDYFLIDKKLRKNCTDSYILTNQLGSDHAPIVLELNSCPACNNLTEKTEEYCSVCGLKLIESENDISANQSRRKIPKDKIILLDLNYTLVANSRESSGRYPERIYNQYYEKDLINLIKDNYVILITARSYKFSQRTLEHIEELTGFKPDEDFWNFGLMPPELKKYWMEEAVLRKHGDNPQKYLAIESNPKTRRMYNNMGIEAYPKEDFI